MFGEALAQVTVKGPRTGIGRFEIDGEGWLPVALQHRPQGNGARSSATSEGDAAKKVNFADQFIAKARKGLHFLEFFMDAGSLLEISLLARTVASRGQDREQVLA